MFRFTGPEKLPVVVYRSFPVFKTHAAFSSVNNGFTSHLQQCFCIKVVPGKKGVPLPEYSQHRPAASLCHCLQPRQPYQQTVNCLSKHLHDEGNNTNSNMTFVKCTLVSGFGEERVRVHSRGRPQEEQPDGPPLFVRVLGTSLRPGGTQGGIIHPWLMARPYPPHSFTHLPACKPAGMVGRTDGTQSETNW